uniref:DUF4440 domain-containing protein n=1 Tax=Plectus sambesii TaxID=2011161 RepID=A0A914VGQ5_9BILA
MSGLEQEIKNRHAEVSKLSKAGDAVGVAEFYDPDCFMIPAGGNLVKGRSGVEEMLKEFMAGGVKNAQFNAEEVNGSGDWAFERGTYEWEVGNGSVSGGYLLVWKKIDGNWLIHNDCFTVNNPSA